MKVLMSVAAVRFFLLLEQNTDAVEESFLSKVVIPAIECSERNSYHARRGRFRNRRSWAAFQNDLTERQFRRYFRMSKDLL